MKSNRLFADDFQPIGRITGTKGLNGALKYIVNNELISVLSSDHVFLSVDNLAVPFRINKKKSDDEILFLEQIRNMEEAGELVGLNLLEFKTIVKENDNSSPYGDLLNYSVQVDGETKGRIVEIILYPSQWMAVILDDHEKENLVPLVAEWMIERDDQLKILIMDLPSGLL